MDPSSERAGNPKVQDTPRALLGKAGAGRKAKLRFTFTHLHYAQLVPGLQGPTGHGPVYPRGALPPQGPPTLGFAPTKYEANLFVW